MCGGGAVDRLLEQNVLTNEQKLSIGATNALVTALQ